MKLKLLLTALLSVFSLVSVAQAPADTLLHASTARSLNLNYSPEILTLNVKQVNGTKDSFHYKFATSAAAAAAEEPIMYVNQTVALRYSDVNSILVVASDTTLTVSFTDNVGSPVSNTFPLAVTPDRSVRSWTGTGEFGIGFPIHRSGKTEWNVISSGIAFGFATPVNASLPLNPSMGRSLEWTWNILLGVEARRGRSSFKTGLGLRYLNINTVARHYLDKAENNQLILRPYDENAREVKSGIHIFSLQIPVFYNLNFAKEWSLSLGPIVNFNTGAHLTTRYKIRERDYKIDTHGIGQRPVSVDALLAVTVGGFGVYARYAPMKVLRERAALDFGTFSTGIILAF